VADPLPLHLASKARTYVPSYQAVLPRLRGRFLSADDVYNPLASTGE
jgi:hypothetical protein